MDFFDDLFSFIKDDTKSSLKLNPIKTDEDKINESDPVSEICIENDEEEEEKENMKLEPCIERVRGKQTINLYQCDDCRYSSNKRSNMVSHMKSKHGTEMVKKTRRLRKYVLNPESALDKFKCNKCEYSTNIKQSLKFHTERVHLEVQKFFCRNCSYKTYMKSTLKRHMKSKHNELNGKILRIGCIKCEQMEEHQNCTLEVKTQSKGGKLKCNECEFSSNRKLSLKFHTEALHLGIQRFLCRHCSYKSYFKYRVKDHMKLIHNEVNAKVLRIGCNQCEGMEEHGNCEGGKIKRKHSKKSEMNRKLKEGKYKCNKCDKGFRNMNLLQYHTQSSHIGIKRFFCRNCSFTCYGNSSIRSHMKSKHNNNVRILRI